MDGFGLPLEIFVRIQSNLVRWTAGYGLKASSLTIHHHLLKDETTISGFDWAIQSNWYLA
jgi:hypothetical protein